MVHAQPIGIAHASGNGRGGYITQPPRNRIDLVQRERSLIAVRACDDVALFAAEQHMLAQIDIVGAADMEHLHTLAAQIVDFDAAFLLGTDHQAELRIGGMNPDGRIIRRISIILDGLRLDIGLHSACNVRRHLARVKRRMDRQLQRIGDRIPTQHMNGFGIRFVRQKDDATLARFWRKPRPH